MGRRNLSLASWCSGAARGAYSAARAAAAVDAPLLTASAAPAFPALNALILPAIAILCLFCIGIPAAVLAQQGSTPPEVEPAPYPKSQQQQAFHILAPGDNLKVSLYSAAGQETFEPVVDAQGEVTLPEIGHIVVSGLRIDEAARLLEQRFAEYYRSPFVDIALTNFGRIRILIYGPMANSQVRNLENRETLFDVLKDIMGSTLRYRNVQLIRGQQALYNRLSASQLPAPGALSIPAPEAVEARASAGTLESISAVLSANRWLDAALADPNNRVLNIDTRQLMKMGRLSELNFQFEEGDILYLPLPKLLVEISGSTLSGTYALEPGETLLDLMVLCGYSNDPGMDLRNVVIQRYGVDGCLERVVVNAAPTPGDAERLAAVEMQNRDVVRIVNFVNQVFVLGQVKGPGVVDYNQDWQVLDYLTAAGGLEPDAHLPFVAIVRHARDLGRPCNATDIIPVDVRKLYQGDCPDDWTIYPGDVIYVPPKGANITLNTVSSAVNTLFLGLNFLDNLNSSNNSNTTTTDKTTGK